ncbi:MAG: HD family phosphohydrolase, partial [Desulfatitalea sp.]|nr:HD family phosphohydrolase [Desulfatitalea sp.]NNJ99626.1 HD family phosphohydrolase [Desulfatitalea sp.]
MSADTGKSKHIRINVLQKQLRWILAALVVGLFLVLLYPNLIIEHHHYDIGDIAENDIKATQDFFIEDQAATAASRDQAVEQVLTVYDFDPRLTQQIVEKTLSAFKRMSDLAAKLQAHLPHGAPQPDDPPSSQVAVNEIESALLARKAEFEALLGIEVSRGAFKLLSNEQFSPAIAETIKKIVITIMTNGVVANKEVLLKEAEKGITLRNVENHTERTTYALRQYYGPDQAKTMVRIVAEPIVESLNYNIINLIVDFSQQLLQPNITFNRAETESRKQQALSDIKPVMYQIKAGEMLLREGERVSKVQLLKLDELRRQETHQDISTINLGTAVMLFILMVVMYTLFFFNPRFHHLNTNKNLFFLCLVLFLVWVITKISMTLSAAQIPNASFVIPPDAFIFAAPVATGAMLICLVLGFDLALPFGLLAATCAALLTGGRLEVMLYFLVGSIMSAFWTQHCRERKVIILAGTKVAVLNAVLASAIGFYTAEPHGTALVWSSALAFLGGILSGIITLGIAPLVEMTFSYSTDITLLELANLDRPILRRLMIEAPGTYHHS